MKNVECSSKKEEETSASCYMRKSEYVMFWQKKSLVIRSLETSRVITLNQTAAAIWLLLDGNVNCDDILKLLQETYPGVKNIAKDMRQTLDMLYQQQAVECIEEDLAQKFTGQKHPALKPLIRIKFIGFWPDFDVSRNYFVTMLACHFEVMVVEQDTSEVDICFYSATETDAGDHWSSVSPDLFNVLWTTSQNNPPMELFDFVFCEDSFQDYPQNRQIILPEWVLFIEPEQFQLESIANNERLARFRPQKICESFTQAIIPNNQDTEDGINTHIPRFNPDKINVSQEPPKYKLTIGMAVYDDYDGVYFSIQALRLYHEEVLKDAEIIIIDNNPDGETAEALQLLAKSHPDTRYIPEFHMKGTAARDLIFRHAAGEYVVCMDSHVLVVPAALEKLVAYLDEHPDCNDLLQGPLLGDGTEQLLGTHFQEQWDKGMYGCWGIDERGVNETAAPFSIPMQGLGLFACRKSAWLGFNPRFKGFGGEEGYIHEKFRQAGHQTLCLPFLRWVHRFYRAGVPYPLNWGDRIYNYYIGNIELGIDQEQTKNHFTELLGDREYFKTTRDVFRDLHNPFHYFDAIYCIHVEEGEAVWETAENKLNRLGIANRIRHIHMTEEDLQDESQALLQQRVVEQAHRQQLENIVIIYNYTIFCDNVLHVLEGCVADLMNREWEVFYFDIGDGKKKISNDSGDSCLIEPGEEILQSHAVALHCTSFSFLIDQVINNEKNFSSNITSAVAQWGDCTAQLGKRYLSKEKMVNYTE